MHQNCDKLGLSSKRCPALVEVEVERAISVTLKHINMSRHDKRPNLKALRNSIIADIIRSRQCVYRATRQADYLVLELSPHGGRTISSREHNG